MKTTENDAVNCATLRWRIRFHYAHMRLQELMSHRLVMMLSPIRGRAP
jgi:hypothetical protein